MADLEITVDARERYAWVFADRQVRVARACRLTRLAPAPPLAPAAPTAAAVRAWACGAGWDVSSSGRVPAAVRTAYEAVHLPPPPG